MFPETHIAGTGTRTPSTGLLTAETEEAGQSPFNAARIPLDMGLAGGTSLAVLRPTEDIRDQGAVEQHETTSGILEDGDTGSGDKRQEDPMGSLRSRVSDTQQLAKPDPGLKEQARASEESNVLFGESATSDKDLFLDTDFIAGDDLKQEFEVSENGTILGAAPLFDTDVFANSTSSHDDFAEVSGHNILDMDQVRDQASSNLRGTLKDDQMTPASLLKKDAIEIPDDLDEADFNIDEELDAEFAALEASFQQNLSIVETNDTSLSEIQTGSLPSLSTASAQVNPVATSYVPIQPVPLQERSQPNDTSFAPAQVLGRTVSSNMSPYAPDVVSQGYATRPNMLADQIKKASTPSFVTGKVAYEDPYALPDTLVTKKRLRPQNSALRSAASVPNLKQSGPPTAQRHVSSNAVPPSRYQSSPMQYVLPDTRPQSSHNPPTAHVMNNRQPSSATQHAQRTEQPIHSQASFLGSHSTAHMGPNTKPQEIFPAQNDFRRQEPNPAVPPIRAHNLAPDQSYQQPQEGLIPASFTPNDLNSRNLPHQTVTQVPQRIHRPEHPFITPQLSSRNSTQIPSPYAPPTRRGSRSYMPSDSSNIPTFQQASSASHHEFDLNASEAPNVMSAHQPIGRLHSPFEHHREVSRASFSVMSEDSEPTRHEIYGDYLHDERGAESRMFHESYAIVEDDIQEAQALQRATSSLSVSSMPNRRETQPFIQSQHIAPMKDSTVHQTPTFSPPRSLESRFERSSFEMSRPSSRSSNQPQRYANTEPNKSPRAGHTLLPDPHASSKLSNNPKRPGQLARATSAYHAYQPFVNVRAASPSTTTSRQNSFLAASHAPGRSAIPDPRNAHPIGKFGFGGKLLTTIPRKVPKFSADGTMTSQVAGPGVVQVRPTREFVAESLLGEYPGPAMHTRVPIKQKRAELQAWCIKQANTLESHRNEDKLLLYQLLSIFLEYSGSIESDSARGKVAALLCPELAQQLPTDELSHFKVPANIKSPSTGPQDEGATLVTMTLTESKVHQLSELLLRGNKDGAFRYACDHAMWAHALLIATRMPSNTWATAVREFAEFELQDHSAASQSLKALYRSFALATENPKEISSRPMMPSENWRRAMAMLLNNRGPLDDPAIMAIGRSLIAQNQIYAGHFCFLLCLKTPIGPTEDQKNAFGLVGLQVLADQSRDELLEAVAMTETYEFALSLGNSKFLGMPHLLGFKILRAQSLADFGHLSEAKKYCDSVTTALKLLSKGSSNLHHVLIEQLRDLSQQIDQNPGEEAASWLSSKIARPKMDNLWGSLEGKFNKFVAGEAVTPSANIDSASSPFARIAQTPAVLSRNQSAVDLSSKASQYTSAQHYAHNSTVDIDQGHQMARPESNYQILVDQPYQQGSDNYSHGLRRKESYSTFVPQGVNVRHASPSIEAIPYRHQPISPKLTTNEGLGGQQNHPNYSALQYDPTAKHINHQMYVPAADQEVMSYAAKNLPTRVGTNTESGEQSTERLQPIALADDPTETLYAPPATFEVQEQTPSTTRQDAKEQNSADTVAVDKKAGWLGGWFGGGKKKESNASEAKVHKAKLGDGMSLAYDPVTKKWINPKGDMPEDKTKTAPPPPMARKPAAAPSPLPATSPSAVTIPVSTVASQNGTAAAPTRPDVAPRKLLAPEDDLAAMLGTGPVPRRAALRTGQPSATSQTLPRAKKGKATKRYVDVFQENQ